MNIIKSFLKAASLLIFLTLIYYLFSAFNENKLSKYCDKFICFEILSLAEFLGLLTAWISLYFVVRSLESWKDSYKFERAIETLSKFEELEIISNQYLSILYQLKNSLIKTENHELISSFYLEEQIYEDKFNKLNYYEKVLHLEHWLNRDKNIKNYKSFKSLLDTFRNMIESASTQISEAHLSEPNYGKELGTETDINRNKESIKKIKLVFEKYRSDEKTFKLTFNKLIKDLNK